MKTNELPKPPRQKTSVVIEGLDTSTPDDLVKDGKCETLHNLRYKEGAWRPVHPHRAKTLPFTLGTGLTIVYHHPAAGENMYIAQLHRSRYRYALYDITKTSASEALVQYIDDTYSEPQTISHFGNVLYIGGVSYLLKEGLYVKFNSSEVYPDVEYTNTLPNTAQIAWNYFSVDTANIELNIVNDSTTTKLTLGKDAWYPLDFFDAALSTAPSTTKFRFMTILKMEKSDVFPTPSEWPEVIFPTSRDGYWSGEYAMFAVLRMQDGSYLNPSPIVLNYSQNYYDPIEEYRYGLLGNVYIDGAGGTWPLSGRAIITKYQSIEDRESFSKNNLPYYFYRLTSTDVKVTLPSSVDDNFVESVALFATHCFQLFDEEAIKNEEQGLYNISKFYKDNQLLDSRFYKVKEVALKDCDTNAEDNTLFFSTRITASTFEDLANNLVYKPTISDDLVGNIALDYNSSLHLADVTSSFKTSYFTNLIDIDENEDRLISLGGVIKKNNKDYASMGDFVLASDFKTKYRNILSAHDTSLIKFLFTSGSTRFVNAKQALNNNLAYYTAPSTNAYKYPDISISSWQEYKENSLTNSIREPNRIQVSSPNNPFSFPFDTSYAVGSANNRILAMQSAAIEMHEMKVGELPLYVFTEEGIFALVAGSNTLYSSVAAINYDKIINPNTLAINGAIVYITEKGVHLLTSAGTQVISQPIHDDNGMPPIDFLSRCKIVWPKQYNEIVLLDEESATGKAYVYNLEAGYWSTRTLQGVKLNTDELYNDNTIYNLADENEQGVLDAEIVTRPIKLGYVEFKRLETIIPRMQMGNCEWTMQIMGAVSPEDYRLLRSVNNSLVTRLPVIIRRTPFSAKYFKVAFEKFRHDGVFAISHIDFEWYARFLHRMR